MRNDDIKIRIDYRDIRKAIYEGIFSGAFAGLSYGANGVFNWYSPGKVVWFEPSFHIDSAILLPGSAQLYLIRDFCKSIGWPNIQPSLNLQIKSSNEKVAASCFSDSLFAAYIPANTGKVVFDLSSIAKEKFIYKWINPVDLSASEELVLTI